MRKLSFLSRTSFLLIFFFGLDKVFAFIRQIIIARQFSLSFELDAFNAANNLPDLLFALISGGALAMAFIPVLTETLTKQGRKAAWDLFSRVANVAFVVTGIVAVFVAILAETIVASQVGIVPGFNASQRGLVAELMRLNLISTVIFSISGLVMAGLQANQHFLFPAIAPTMYNLGQIFGALILSPDTPYTIGPITLPAFGLGVHGLVYGVIIGAAMHLGIQIPALIRFGFRWTPSLNMRHPGLQEGVRVIGPRLLTMFLIQLMFIARDNFASRLDQIGAISALTYGWMIMQVPETLIGTAIATAMLPTLAEHFSRGKLDEFRKVVERAIQVMLALAIPGAAILAVVLRPFVDLTFGFDAAGTDLLTGTARVFLLTLMGYVVHEVIVRAFYAQKRAWQPFYGAAIRIVIYVGMGILGMLFFNHIGAPLIAFLEIALTVETVILLIWLDRKLPRSARLGLSILRAIFAAVAGSLIAFVLMRVLPLSEVLNALSALLGGALVAGAIICKELRLLLQL